MKGFWAGAFASLLTGLLLFAGTEAYNSWKSARSTVLSYEIEDGAVLVDNNIRDVLRQLDLNNEIAKVRLVNIGQKDLENVTIEISDIIAPEGNNIIDFGVLETIGEGSATPSASKRDGKVLVSYPILRRNEGVIIWIANKGFSTFRLKNNIAGLVMDEVSPLDRSDEDLWNLAFYAGLCLGSVFLGMVLSEVLNRHVLRSVGLDPDEVAKLYAKKQQGDKNG